MGSGGGSGGSVEKQAVTAEVNRRDYLGRTVLHLAVSETDPWALDWVELLLAVPMLQANLPDTESGWTALHRALYIGNIAAARLLLARDDVDTRVKDSEGLTPFDVYNSTIDGTNPSDTLLTSPGNPGRLEMFSWGANRNFTLGFASDNERQLPERVHLKREEGGKGLAAFEPLRIRDVSMARLHSGIVTDEKRNNMRLCGYGQGGRLGPTTQTQFTFAPLRDFPHQISQVALSPDHTVVVTTAGDVWTFGTARFSQLGYPLDPPAKKGGKDDEPVQAAPRKVAGALKKEVVLGASASRTHTAVFTADALFVFGTNKGQFGFPIAGDPVQILPRKVPTVQQPVIQITATDNATACLLDTRDVVVLYREGYLKIAFPLTPFPSKIVAYRPPQVAAKPNITKIVSCGNTFAALSSLGDVFTFTLDTSAQESASSLARYTPKPQRVWNLRRKMTAVTDVSVGLDGSIIICTVSGHVFLRSKKFEAAASSSKVGSSSSSSGGYRFSRVPYLQRVIKVAANSTGGFAALRADVPLRFIEIEGATLARDFLHLLPHWQRIGPLPATAAKKRGSGDGEDSDEEDDTDAVIEKDIEVASKLMAVVGSWDLTWEVTASGTDAVVNAGTLSIPAHKAVLSARSSSLAQHLSSHRTLNLDCSPLAALLFLHYLYSDDFPAVWDTRVGLPLRASLPQDIKLDVGAVKLELQRLAQAYDLPALAQSLERQVKTPPAPTLASDFGNLLQLSLAKGTSFPAGLKPDVVLQLADREVKAHSVVLRARCPFFATFFDDADWAAERRKGGVVKFDVQHVSWEVMHLVLDHIYRDVGMSLFQTVERPTAEEYIDFTVQVLAVANELLLDKLKQVCSAVLRSFVTLHNVVSILCDAAFYEARDLARACMYFLASSMETALEGGLLDDLPADLLVALTAFVQERQGAKMPVSRSGLLLQEVLAKHADYLADIDVGRPTGAAKRYRPAIVPNSPKPSPSLLSPTSSPALGPSKSPRMQPKPSPSLAPVGEVDEPFALDEDFLLDAGSSTPRGLTSPPPPSAAVPGMSRRRSSLVPMSSSPSQASFMTLGSPPPARLQPWSSPAPVETAKTSLDLRSIMANESAAAGRRASVSKVPASTPTTPSGGSGLAMSSPSWRPVTSARPSSLASIQSEQATPLLRRPSIPSPASATPARPSPSPLTRPTPPASSPSSRSDPAAASGPVYTPSRLPSSSSRAPKASFGGSDAPWQNFERISTPTPPIVASTSSFDPFSPPLPAASFAAIQSEQIARAAEVKSHKAPRSFAELMQEEQAQAAAKEEEDREAKEFAAWFEAESKRVQEEQAALRAQVASPVKGKKGGKGGGGGGSAHGGGKGKAKKGDGVSKQGEGSGKKPDGGAGKKGGNAMKKASAPAPPPLLSAATSISALRLHADAPAFQPTFNVDAPAFQPSSAPSPSSSGASTPQRGAGGGSRGGQGGGGAARGRGRGGRAPGGPGPVPSPPPGVKV
ncbi:hypothetical protein JCM10213v2_005824 [Rhodosporidiobolus nylandii]